MRTDGTCCDSPSGFASLSAWQVPNAGPLNSIRSTPMKPTTRDHLSDSHAAPTDAAGSKRQLQQIWCLREIMNKTLCPLVAAGRSSCARLRDNTSPVPRPPCTTSSDGPDPPLFVTSVMQQRAPMIRMCLAMILHLIFAGRHRKVWQHSVLKEPGHPQTRGAATRASSSINKHRNK